MKLKIFNSFWRESRDAFFLFDSSICFLDANPTALRFMGKKLSELVGRKLVDVYPESGASGRLGIYQAIIRTGKPRVFKNVFHPGWRRRLDIYAFRLLGGLGMIASDITRPHITASRLENTSRLLKDLSLHNELLREEQTKALAREIHDEMAPILTTFKMDIHWIKSWIQAVSPAQNAVSPAPSSSQSSSGVASGARPSSPSSPSLSSARTSSPSTPRLDLDPAVEAKITSMSNLVDQTIDLMRHICSELRPALLDDLGLLDALQWQVEECRKRSGLDCRLIIDCNGYPFTPNLSLSLFRIFQESLTNVVRHARATKAYISLTHSRSNGELRLRVRDNGRGILPSEASGSKSFGLIGMRERLGPYNGRFKISGSPGKGTTVSVTIPSARKHLPCYSMRPFRLPTRP